MTLFSAHIIFGFGSSERKIINGTTVDAREFTKTINTRVDFPHESAEKQLSQTWKLLPSVNGVSLEKRITICNSFTF